MGGKRDKSYVYPSYNDTYDHEDDDDDDDDGDDDKDYDGDDDNEDDDNDDDDYINNFTTSGLLNLLPICLM
jgi:hypothetical protein